MTTKTFSTTVRVLDHFEGCPYCGAVDPNPTTHLGRCEPPKREPLSRPSNGWPWERVAQSPAARA